MRWCSARPLIHSVSVLMLAITACNDDPTGCDPCRTDAIVYGTLTGSAVSRRDISIVAYDLSCGADLRAGIDITTDEQGAP